MTGLRTPFGALLVSPDGQWQLYDASNKTVVGSAGAPSFDGVVLLPVDAAPGLGQPCLGNGEFGPPFHWDKDAGYQV